jgi:hypothetical protein
MREDREVAWNEVPDAEQEEPCDEELNLQES